jgi:ATP-binding cassette, subfamily C, bacterial CydCD
MPLPHMPQNEPVSPDSSSVYSRFPGFNAINFREVHFAYEDGRSALNGVSFQITNGQKVALVGPSGAGKSTIANLLLQFIAPDKGQILVDGCSLAEIPADEWRQRVAWLPQNPYLFHDTIAANIRLGRPEAGLEEVIYAAQLAQLHEFVASLPDGYDTIIGERGARLSGGQAQRLALARAFLKNAPIVILDEATANLDPELENSLQQVIETLLKGRTALIIAHRLKTVVHADRILVLDQGRVIQSGAHGELLKQPGLYQHLVKTASETEIALDQYDLTHLPGPDPRSLQPVEITTKKPIQEYADLNLSPLRRLLGLVIPFKGLVALSILSGFAAIGSGIGLMGASAYIISAAALHPSIAELQVAIVGVRFFGIIRGLFRYLERLVSHEVTFRLLARLRIWLYQVLEPLAPARLMGYRSGDLLARIIGDIESLENFYVRALAPPLVAVLIALAVGIFMLQYQLLLAIVLLTLFALAAVGIPLLVYLLGQNTGRQLVDQRAALDVALVEGIQGLPELLVYGQARRRAEQIAALSRELGGSQRALARVTGLQAGLNALLSGLGMWAVLVCSILLLHNGQIQGISIAVLALVALTSFEAALPLSQAFQYLESNLEAGRRLFELADLRPVVQDPPVNRSFPELATQRAGSNDSNCPALSIHNLSFKYPSSIASSPYTLHGMSFDLAQGGRLAIVGPSGAGKSTLVNLLLRFWDYQEGEILLGGRELRSYGQEDVRQLISVVAQNTYLFSASIRENLLIACPGASDEQIIRAAQSAQIHQFIQSLPQGYNTWIGEQGLRLSGGERQRLAIARALLKDAPILILDEATANLDALTEHNLLRAIHQDTAGRTTITITHRLVGMDTMDEILVLHQGRIVERGRLDELMGLKKQYWRMYQLQLESTVM